MEAGSARREVSKGGGRGGYLASGFLGFWLKTLSLTWVLGSKMALPGAAEPSTPVALGRCRSEMGILARDSPLAVARSARIGFESKFKGLGSTVVGPWAGGGGGFGMLRYSRTPGICQALRMKHAAARASVGDGGDGDGTLSASVWVREKAFAVDQ